VCRYCSLTGSLSQSDFHDVSLSDCVNKATGMAQPLAEKRRVRVITNIGSDITIEGDGDRLTEAFLNIIENGVKYGHDSGSVKVLVREDSGKAVVTVRDCGTGIRKEDMERIYDRFFRADSSRDTEGTGLGLSIAKAIIEAHGGQIIIQSEWGKGTTSSVTLPKKSSVSTITIRRNG
jgi:two-component system phosphate regulon sensor histidine kinase PhoR